MLKHTKLLPEPTDIETTLLLGWHAALASMEGEGSASANTNLLIVKLRDGPTKELAQSVKAWGVAHKESTKWLTKLLNDAYTLGVEDGQRCRS